MRALIVTRPREGTGVRVGLNHVVVALTFLAIGYLALQAATDPDYGWHVANGRHLLDGVLLGGRDTYSWTAAGAPWVAHEWLTDGAMAFLHDTFGPVANSLAAAAVVLVAFALVAVRVRARGHGWPLTSAVTLLAAIAAYGSMGVRPQMLELLYLAAALVLCEAWLRRQLGTAAFAVIGALGTLLWANTHGSFFLAPAVLGVVTVGLLVLRDRRAVAAALLAGLALVVPLLNPWGPALFGFATESLRSQVAQTVIQEWRVPDLLSLGFVAFDLELVLLAAGAALAGWRLLSKARDRRAQHPSAADLAAILLSAGLTLAALRSGRFVMLVGIAAAPLLAWVLGEIALAVRARQGAATGDTSDTSQDAPRPDVHASPDRVGRPAGAEHDAPGRSLVNLVAIVAVTLVLGAIAWGRISPAGQQRALHADYPYGTLPALDRIAASTAARGEPLRLLNAWEYGGLLLMDRPGVKVFIDGRSEVYGDAQLLRYGELLGLVPGWQQRLADLGVDAVLMPRASALPGALQRLGWRVAAADEAGVLLVPPSGA